MQRLSEASAAAETDVATKKRTTPCSLPDGPSCRGASPSEVYSITVVAFGNTHTIPVTQSTRVNTIIREVADRAWGQDYPWTPEELHATLFHKNKSLPGDGTVGMLPRDAVLHFHTSVEATGTSKTSPTNGGASYSMLMPYMKGSASQATSKSQVMTASNATQSNPLPISPPAVSDCSESSLLYAIPSYRTLSPSWINYSHPSSGYLWNASSTPAALHCYGTSSPSIVTSGYPWERGDQGLTFHVPITSSNDLPFRSAPGSILFPIHSTSDGPPPPVYQPLGKQLSYRPTDGFPSTRRHSILDPVAARGTLLDESHGLPSAAFRKFSLPLPLSEVPYSSWKETAMRSKGVSTSPAATQTLSTAQTSTTSPLTFTDATLVAQEEGASMKEEDTLVLWVELPSCAGTHNSGKSSGGTRLSGKAGRLTAGSPNPGSASPSGGTRRLRISRSFPMGVLRELFAVEAPLHIYCDGALIEDERQSFDDHRVGNLARIHFACLPKDTASGKSRLLRRLLPGGGLSLDGLAPLRTSPDSSNRQVPQDAPKKLDGRRLSLVTEASAHESNTAPSCERGQGKPASKCDNHQSSTIRTSDPTSRVEQGKESRLETSPALPPAVHPSVFGGWRNRTVTPLHVTEEDAGTLSRASSNLSTSSRRSSGYGSVVDGMKGTGRPNRQSSFGGAQRTPRPSSGSAKRGTEFVHEGSGGGAGMPIDERQASGEVENPLLNRPATFSKKQISIDSLRRARKHSSWGHRGSSGTKQINLQRCQSSEVPSMSAAIVPRDNAQGDDEAAFPNASTAYPTRGTSYCLTQSAAGAGQASTEPKMREQSRGLVPVEANGTPKVVSILLPSRRVNSSPKLWKLQRAKMQDGCSESTLSTHSSSTVPSSSVIASSSSHCMTDSTEQKRRLRLTLQDPHDSSKLHFNVVVEADCPVVALREWLKEYAVSDAKRIDSPNAYPYDSEHFTIYCGDTALEDDTGTTFSMATCGRNDYVFTLRQRE